VQKPVQICHKVCAKTLGTNHLKVAFSLPETDPKLVFFTIQAVSFPESFYAQFTYKFCKYYNFFFKNCGS
jgi:hypothetical protein